VSESSSSSSSSFSGSKLSASSDDDDEELPLGHRKKLNSSHKSHCQKYKKHYSAAVIALVFVSGIGCGYSLGVRFGGAQTGGGGGSSGAGGSSGGGGLSGAGGSSGGGGSSGAGGSSGGSGPNQQVENGALNVGDKAKAEVDQSMFAQGENDPGSDLKVIDDVCDSEMTSRCLRSRCMRDERNRLATYDNARGWPKEEKVSARSLAEAGFFYTGPRDRVMCAFCRGQLENWGEGEDAMHGHREHYGKCEFVGGKDVGNVPMALPASGV